MAKKTKYSHLSREQIESKLEKLERERYGLVWEDKEEEVAKQCEIELPVLKEDTSREIASDITKPYNFIIEGDNYHSLYTLNFTHKKKIDVIYIDPPYNTGNKNEWKYNDKWVDKNDKYKHSHWLSFMNKRLKLAKNLLKNTGVIFISIDENEIAQLKLLCDKIFGENNFVTQIIVQVNKGGRDYLPIAITHEYVLCYFKSDVGELNELPKDISHFKLTDKYGKYELRELRNRNPKFNRENRPNLFYPIYVSSKSKNENGHCFVSLTKSEEYSIEIYPLNSKGEESCWRWGKELFQQNIFEDFDKTNIIAKSKNGNTGWNIYEKSRKTTSKAKSIWDESNVRTEQGTIDLREIGLINTFQFPKPVYLINKILQLATDKSSLILDFFAGSGTTGHAVLELNKEDGGNRQFILCTNNENNICEEVTYSRIKKVIEGYADKAGIPANVKYFKQTFVPNILNDKDKRKLVSRSTELLCMAENTFENVVKRSSKSEFAIYKNVVQQTAIIYDEDGVEKCVSKLNSINSPLETVIYVFSYDHTYDEESFENLKINFSVKPIPEAILNIYRKIAKMSKK